MSVTMLPLDPGARARAFLRHLLESGDIVDTDAAGRTVISLAVDRYTLEWVLTFEAETEDLEDADGEPEEDEAPDPVVLFDPRPRRIRGR